MSNYRKPNPDILAEVVKMISNLHKSEPSDQFIKSIEDTDTCKFCKDEPCNQDHCPYTEKK